MRLLYNSRIYYKGGFGGEPIGGVRKIMWLEANISLGDEKKEGGLFIWLMTLFTAIFHHIG